MLFAFAWSLYNTGSKRIYAGDFSRGTCTNTRFQPFLFWTNGSMTDCVYAKSHCSEEGQVIYSDNSTKDDRTCRCDNKKNYSFIKTPRNVFFCIPTEEDCSCYDTSHLTNSTTLTGSLCKNMKKNTNKIIETIRNFIGLFFLLLWHKWVNSLHILV